MKGEVRLGQNFYNLWHFLTFLQNIYPCFFLQLGLKKHHYLPLAHKPTRSNLKRKAWLKWLIPTYMYNKRFFPQFLSGSGYLVTHSAAECLLLKTKVSNDGGLLATSVLADSTKGESMTD